MKRIHKAGISALIIALSLFCLYFFRNIPQGKLWNGYRILYVPYSASSLTVNEDLVSSGCKDVISPDEQYIPLLLSAETPEISLLSSPADDTGYLKKRNSFFSDRSGKYRLYYIPSRYDENALKAVQKLSSDGILSGLDSEASYPWAVPAVCLLFAVFLFIISKNKKMFFSCAVFPVLFSLSIPFYSGAAAVCLILYAFFLMLKVFGRPGAVTFIIRNRTIVIFAGTAFLCCIFTSLRGILLFLCALAGSASGLSLYINIQKIKTDRQKFKFVPIRPAKLVSFTAEQAVKALAVCASGIGILFFTLVISSRISIGPQGKHLQLPAAQGSASRGDFPDLSDYTDWVWRTLTFPYNSLNNTSAHKAPKDGDTVEFPRFADSSSGIAVKKSVVLRYDESFRTKTVDSINNLPFPAVEKLMKKQGKSLAAGFAASGTGQSDIFTLILLFASALIPLFYYIKLTIGGKKNDVSCVLCK